MQLNYDLVQPVGKNESFQPEGASVMVQPQTPSAALERLILAVAIAGLPANTQLNAEALTPAAGVPTAIVVQRSVDVAKPIKAGV